MKVQCQAVRDKPSVSRVELFDSLMTISSFTKALANKVMLLPTEKLVEGGNEDATKNTQHFSTKQ